VEGSFEHGNERLRYVKYWQILEYVSEMEASQEALRSMELVKVCSEVIITTHQMFEKFMNEY
jgi:hypothetical protein